MKKTATVLLTMLFCFALRFGVLAEDSYSEIYKQSGAGDIENSLDRDTRAFFDSEGIDPADSGWVNSLKAENVFSHIWKFIKGGARAPFKAGFSVLGIVIIAAAVRAYSGQDPTDTAVKFAVVLSISAILAVSVYSSITAAVNMIKGSSTFMMAFVPVYMSLLTVSGTPVTAAASGALLLGAAEFIAGTAAFGLTAVMGAYMALGISSSVSPLLGGFALADTFKKAGMWVMSLFATVFVGILSVTSAVNSAADSVTARTAKFILGTCVPVAGTALSGAVSTVSSSVALLKTSVGIYGVVALAVMFLPVLIELLLWRLVLGISGGVCEAFSLNETAKLLKAVDSMIAFLTGALLLVGATFIISLSVTVSAGKGL